MRRQLIIRAAALAIAVSAATACGAECDDIAGLDGVAVQIEQQADVDTARVCAEGRCASASGLRRAGTTVTLELSGSERRVDVEVRLPGAAPARTSVELEPSEPGGDGCEKFWSGEAVYADGRLVPR